MKDRDWRMKKKKKATYHQVMGLYLHFKKKNGILTQTDRISYIGFCIVTFLTTL